ncbi:MAG TPA: hypothetical protein VE736_00305 [Gaiellaceae bacterium]|nr:hypothetical protein [Gaiellaceae bacterium]
MTLTQSERDARRRRRRRAELARWALRLAVVLIVFGLGIALGQALHDNPKPGGTISLERTLSVPSVPPGSTATP